MQGLGGLAPGLNRGATMSGNKSGASLDTSPLKFMYVGPNSAGARPTTSFTVLVPGVYRFPLWGAGGGDGSSSGGYGSDLGIKTVRLRKDDTVSFVMGYPSASTAADRASTATFPDGSVMSVGGGGDSSRGAVSGADIVVAGAANSGATGGAAGSYEGFIGGPAITTPGGGRIGSQSVPAGASMVMAIRIGD